MSGRPREAVHADLDLNPDATMADALYLEVLLDIRDLLQRLVDVADGFDSERRGLSHR